MNTKWEKGDESGDGTDIDEIETDIDTLLIQGINQITNENLLYSKGNSTQCSGVN